MLDHTMQVCFLQHCLLLTLHTADVCLCLPAVVCALLVLMPVTGLMNMYYCQSAFTKQVRVPATPCYVNNADQAVVNGRSGCGTAPFLYAGMTFV